MGIELAPPRGHRLADIEALSRPERAQAERPSTRFGGDRPRAGRVATEHGRGGATRSEIRNRECEVKMKMKVVKVCSAREGDRTLLVGSTIQSPHQMRTRAARVAVVGHPNGEARITLDREDPRGFHASLRTNFQTSGRTCAPTREGAIDDRPSGRGGAPGNRTRIYRLRTGCSAFELVPRAIAVVMS
jgi:hypothetical protein